MTKGKRRIKAGSVKGPLLKLASAAVIAASAAVVAAEKK